MKLIRVKTVFQWSPGLLKLHPKNSLKKKFQLSIATWKIYFLIGWKIVKMEKLCNLKEVIVMMLSNLHRNMRKFNFKICLFILSHTGFMTRLKHLKLDRGAIAEGSRVSVFWHLAVVGVPSLNPGEGRNFFYFLLRWRTMHSPYWWLRREQ